MVAGDGVASVRKPWNDGRRVERPNAALIRRLYEARDRDVLGEHTGDLRGPDVVLDMMRDARERVVALVDWSAKRDDETLEGKEVAVYRVRNGKIFEATFHQENQVMERQFWE